MMPDSVDDNLACRICMDLKDSYVSLFTHELSKKVMEVADVQVEEDDGLPSTICVECNVDLEKCYEFRLKVQHADKKFRDHIAFSQVEIEECKIKEEREPYTNDGHSDNMDDRDSSSSTDDENFNNEPDESPKKDKENEEIEPDPMNHVVVIEEKDQLTKIEMPEVALCHDEPMIEDEIKKVEEVVVDPLGCKTEVMDVDNINHPETFTPSSSVQSSSVNTTELSMPLSCALPAIRPSNLIVLPRFKPLNSESSMFQKSLEVGNEVKGCSRNLSDTQMSLSYPCNDDLYRNREPSTFLAVNRESWINSLPVDSSENVATSQSHINLHFESSFYNKIKTSEKAFSCVQTMGLDQNTSILPSCTSKPKAGLIDQIYTPNNSQTTNTKHSPSSLVLHPIKHIQQNKGVINKDYFCSACNVDFENIQLFQEHKEQEGFLCVKCFASFKSHVVLEEHFNSHKKYPCKTCGKVFHFQSDLTGHRNIIGPCYKKKYSCELCNTTYTKKANLSRHKILNHLKLATENICIVCKKNFKSPELMSNHLIRCHFAYEHMECSICPRVLCGPVNLKIHMRLHTTRNTYPHDVLSCSTCKKHFPSKTKLQEHIDSYHDSKEITCDICAETFKGKGRYYKHVEYRHSKGPFPCRKCNEKFDSRRQWNSHRKTHSRKNKAPQPVWCEICGKRYKSKAIYSRHLAIHSEDKPFMCDMCGASFKQKVGLRQHQRTHSDVKSFCCNNCGFATKWKHALENHLKKCITSMKTEESGSS